MQHAQNELEEWTTFIQGYGIQAVRKIYDTYITLSVSTGATIIFDKAGNLISTGDED